MQHSTRSDRQPFKSLQQHPDVAASLELTLAPDTPSTDAILWTDKPLEYDRRMIDHRAANRPPKNLRARRQARRRMEKATRRAQRRG